MEVLVDAFERMQNKDFDYQIRENVSNEFRYLYDSYNRMANNINELVHTVYESRILLRDAEYRYLQAQINPHFLYNCFFLLNGQIQLGDIDAASQMSRKLGRYFKFITHGEHATIPLADEYEQAMIYSEIQMLRFGTRLFIDCTPLPEALKAVKVPRLIIQPLIENAFEHGVRGYTNGEIRLWAGERDGTQRGWRGFPAPRM